MRQTITLTTGKAFVIAPLTLGQALELTELSDAVGKAATILEVNELLEIRLLGCHYATANGDNALSPHELAFDLSPGEADELFFHAMRITRNFMELPAFGLLRCNGRNHLREQQGQRVLTHSILPQVAA